MLLLTVGHIWYSEVVLWRLMDDKLHYYSMSEHTLISHMQDRQLWLTGHRYSRKDTRRRGSSLLVYSSVNHCINRLIYFLQSTYPRIKQHIWEGEVKWNKQFNLKSLLHKKIASIKYPMQELNYPTTKGKVYSKEEDHYLLCHFNYYGMMADDMYRHTKKDITEFSVFQFHWFFKSQSPHKLQRWCNTLLGMIEKEVEVKQWRPKWKGVWEAKWVSILPISLEFAET